MIKFESEKVCNSRCKRGLGNQIFTISFAQYLKNNDYKVYVDTKLLQLFS